MADEVHNTHILKQQIFELNKQIKELQSSLTEERVSNLEFDQTQKEQKIKIDELTDLLAKEKLKNQQLNQQIQELQIQTDEKTHNFQEQTHNFQQYITSQHQQLLVQNNIINQYQLQQQQQQQMNNNNRNKDDEFGKYDIKFEDDNESEDSEHLEANKELRHRLLEEQMRHEQLKHVHRQSISKLEQYEIDELQKYETNNHNSDEITNNNNNNNNNKLLAEIESLRRQLEDERKKRESLDRERRNSLAALSQNMFKKLLDSEHQHYDDKSDLEHQCNTLKQIVKHLEKSKQNLLHETSKTIDDLREHIKVLSNRLQKYENWD